MTNHALNRVADEHLFALGLWAAHVDEPIEVAAESFLECFRGQFDTIVDFAAEWIIMENCLPGIFSPYFDLSSYVEVIFGIDGAFISIGFEGGVAIFQIAEELGTLERAYEKWRARIDERP